MKWITTHDKKLHVQERRSEVVFHESSNFLSAFTAHAVHEMLFDPVIGSGPPMFPALAAVRTALADAPARSLMWIDSAKTLYPPAVMAGSALPNQLHILRPVPQDVIWATVECLRCRHVAAVVSLVMHRPTRVEVRRMQLAAEQGGGVGVLLRPNLASAGADIYAAATRWRISPTPGERTIQRWKIEQLHGQGRRTHSSFVLEKHRATGQTHFVYPSAAVANHPLLPAVS